MKPSAQKNIGIEELPSVAQSLSSLLLQTNPFVLWLHGDLGAGKTTFSRELLWSLGLNRKIPVPSPTFTYLNSYETPHGIIAHIDLYRAEKISNVEEFLSLDSVNYRGFLVEWPERLLAADLLTPTHRLHLKHVGDNVRSMEFASE
jgi:tRNA threonylcarbamoyl adenosine modification protein YjeE